MTFREMYGEDLTDVFFDPEEFGSEHTIDGVLLTVVLKEADFESGGRGSELKNAFNPKESAVNKKTLVLCIREEDVEKKLERKKLTVNAMIEVDGKKMFIYSVSHTMGMYRLVVGQHGI